jgi:hypothetical protein
VLAGEFASRAAADPVGAGGSETVAFWIRRIAHETAVHRVDAELALGQPITPIPAERAVDGIEEMLQVFLEYQTRAWPGDYAADLVDWGDRSVLVSAGGHGWRVTLRPDGAVVGSANDTGHVRAGIGGEPAAVLLWLYNRTGDRHVSCTGDIEMITRLKRLLTAGTGVN